jgi:hypothetical protein
MRKLISNVENWHKARFFGPNNLGPRKCTLPAKILHLILPQILRTINKLLGPRTLNNHKDTNIFNARFYYL